MKPLLKAAVLLTSSLTLTAASCTPDPVLAPVKPPESRLQCVAAGERPIIPAEIAIDWSGIATVTAAREAHEAFVQRLRTREGIIAGYLVEIEGKLFACSNNAAWLRDFYAGMER